MRRRIKHSTKQKIIVWILIAFVLIITAAICYLIISKQIKQTYQVKIDTLNEQIIANTRDAYVATRDISFGEAITDENVELRKICSSIDATEYVTANQIGKVATMNIHQGVSLLNGMVTDDNYDNDLRISEYEVINLKSFGLEDVVDVRLFFPNGEDYIVLSKKNIKYISEDRVTSQFWVTEEELLLMSSAIIDAYLYDGAYLYTTKYVEPTIQDAAQVTYTPSLASIKLIEENPNIIKTASETLSNKLRKELENRLANSLKSDVENIDWQINTNDNRKVKKEGSTSSDGTEDMPSPESSVTPEDFTYYSEEEKDKEKDPNLGP